MKKFLITLSCPDRPGIVAAVSGYLIEQGGNILESAQFTDVAHERLFMRVCFEAADGVSLPPLTEKFAPVAEKFAMQWAIHDAAVKPRLLLMVSRFGHCLNDLLYRYRIGALPVEIPAIVSNHRDFYKLAADNGIPFHHLPVDPTNKPLREKQLMQIVDEEKIDLVVLARYMQILSSDLCQQLSERAINIHHSFLPSFQGARPHQQAYERGVKLIGATAHYVTRDLDEGPIIEQDVARVDHAMSVEDLAAIGRDVECGVLARAVTWHVQHRVFMNGQRTVVFR